MPRSRRAPASALGLGRAHARDRPVGSAEHLGQRPARAQLAVRDHHHVVHALGHLGQQVARHQHGAPAAGLVAQQVAHPADAGRVEPVAGLVEDQHLGVAQQRRRDGEPLAHAHRVALHPAVARLGQPDLLEHLVGAARPDGRPPRPGCAGGCARCGRDGSSRPRARRPPGGSGARGRRRPSRRRWPCRRSRGSGREASAGWSTCRRRWGRGTRSRAPPRPRTRGRRPPARARSACSGPGCRWRARRRRLSDAPARGWG